MESDTIFKIDSPLSDSKDGKSFEDDSSYDSASSAPLFGDIPGDESPFSSLLDSPKSASELEPTPFRKAIPLSKVLEQNRRKSMPNKSRMSSSLPLKNRVLFESLHQAAVSLSGPIPPRPFDSIITSPLISSSPSFADLHEKSGDSSSSQAATPEKINWILDGNTLLPDRVLKVLVVDDNSLTCKILSMMCKQLSCECTVVFNGVDALRECMGEKKYDVILMDIIMPICKLICLVC